MVHLIQICKNLPLALEETSYKLLLNFLSSLVDLYFQHKKPLFVYFHNFKTFDSLFLYELMFSTSYWTEFLRENNLDFYYVANMEEGIKYLDIHCKSNDESKLLISFRDSCILLPSTLKILAKTFNLPGKLPFDHNITKIDIQNPEYRDRLKSYISRDTWILYQVLKKSELVLQQIHPKLHLYDFKSLAKCSFDAWKETYPDLYRYAKKELRVSPFTLPNLKVEQFTSGNPSTSGYSFLSRQVHQSQYDQPIYLHQENARSWIRNSYYGGRAEVFKPKLLPHAKKLYSYDVNSLYPWALSQEMPYGKAKQYDQISWDAIKNEPQAFVHALVNAPTNLYIPVLPWRANFPDQQTTLYPVGVFEGVWHISELQLAEEYGYEIVAKNAIVFEKTKFLFYEWINELYNKRQEAQQQDLHGLSLWYKLIMNTLYGRFALREDYPQTLCFDTDENPDVRINDFYNVSIKKEKYKTWITHTGPQKSIKSFTNKEVRQQLYRYLKQKRETPFSIQWSATTTAHARCFMYRLMSKYKENLYYSDTDSLYLDTRLSNELVGSGLGKFKLENEILDALFITSKCYALKLNDEKYVFKMSGMPSENLKLTWEDYIEAYKGNPCKQTWVHDFVRSKKKFSIIKKDKKTISFPVRTKQRKLIMKSKEWVDTLPFHVKKHVLKPKETLTALGSVTTPEAAMRNLILERCGHKI